MNYTARKILVPAFLLALLVTTGYASLAQTILKVAGTAASPGFSGDGGTATTAQLNAPVSVAVDKFGNKYISDKSNNRIRKVDSSGIITTFAGTGMVGYAGDGGPASAAKLNTPAGIATDTFGNVYLADQYNHCIRKINLSGIITTIAGNGAAGFSGDGTAAVTATLQQPEDVTTDAAGNIYIADYGNSRVRKVNTSGIITTIAGISSYGSSGDGGAATLAMIVPYRLAVDAAGNVYAAEYWYHKIRQINTSGIINTVIGNGTSGFTGDGGPATAALISYPYGIAVDRYGQLFINDQGNRRIRKVDIWGNINTYGGIGSFGCGGDGGAAISALLKDVRNVAVNDSGDVFFADITCHTARVIKNHNRPPSFTSGASAVLDVCQNSSPNALYGVLSITDADTGQVVCWSVLASPVHGALTGFNYFGSTTGSIVAPWPLMYQPTSGYAGNDSFKVKVSDGQKADTIVIYVHINTHPSAGIISGPTAVCLTHTINLTETVTGGVWRVTNACATITTGGLVTGMVPGLDTVWYSVNTSCGRDSVYYIISVDPFVDLSGISGMDSICPGDTIVLTDPTPGGVWMSADPAILQSLGGGSYLGISGGITTVMYILSNACGTDTAFGRNFYVYSAAQCAAGITKETLSHEYQLQIMPNPGKGDFKFHFASPQRTEATVLVTDVLGRTVASFTVAANSETLISLNVQPGIYLVTARTSSAILTTRLVVEK